MHNLFKIYTEKLNINLKSLIFINMKINKFNYLIIKKILNGQTKDNLYKWGGLLWEKKMLLHIY